MILPNYFYGVLPKTGSTCIYALLGAHPDLFVPGGNHVRFFTVFYDRGLDWYAQCYAGASPDRTLRCDLKTEFDFMTEAQDRLARDVPEARLCFSLRNPVERDWSAYQHLPRKRQASGLLEIGIDTAHRTPSGCSAYASAIERSRRLFGRERTLVPWFDDIRADPQSVADTRPDFLGTWPRTISDADGTARKVARAALYRNLNGMLKRGAIAMHAAGLGTALGRLKDSEVIDRVLFSGEWIRRLKNVPDPWTFFAARHATKIDRFRDMLSPDLSHLRSVP